MAEICGECGKPEGPGETWINCSVCNLWFHCKCQHLDKKAYETINKYKDNLNYKCNACKGQSDSVKPTVDESITGLYANMNQVKHVVLKLMDEFHALKQETVYLHKDINLLKTKVDTLSKPDSSMKDMVKDLSARVDNLSEKSKSFGDSVLKKLESQPSLPAPILTDVPSNPVVPTYAQTTTKNIIVLKANDETKKAADHHRSIAEALNKIPVNDTRVSKSGHLVLELKDKKTMESALNIIKQSEKQLNVEASVKNKITPKICIANISELADMSCITDDIINKNGWLKTLVSQGKLFSLITKFKNKRNGFDLVFKVSPEIRKCLRDRTDEILTPYSVCKVYDRYHVIQCYKCLEFNHLSKNCKSRVDSCMKCAGNHKMAECTSSAPCCKNCKSDENSSHMANSRECPKYAEEVSKVRNRTDHGAEN